MSMKPGCYHAIAADPCLQHILLRGTPASSCVESARTRLQRSGAWNAHMIFNMVAFARFLRFLVWSSFKGVTCFPPRVCNCASLFRTRTFEVVTLPATPGSPARVDCPPVCCRNFVRRWATRALHPGALQGPCADTAPRTRLHSDPARRCILRA